MKALHNHKLNMGLEPPVCDIALNQSELTTVQLKQI
jgi:hypothetical protein